MSVSTLRECRGDDLQGCNDTPPPTPHFSCHRPHRQKALERALGVVLHLAVVRVAVVAVRPAARAAVYLDGDPTRILMTTSDEKVGAPPDELGLKGRKQLVAFGSVIQHVEDGRL